MLQESPASPISLPQPCPRPSRPAGAWGLWGSFADVSVYSNSESNTYHDVLMTVSNRNNGRTLACSVPGAFLYPFSHLTLTTAPGDRQFYFPRAHLQRETEAQEVLLLTQGPTANKGGAGI